MQEAYPPDSSVSPSSTRPHWIVGTHHRLRTLSFANSLAFSAVHVWSQPRGRAIWLLLGLVFLVYPQLAYWRARRAPDSQGAELQNLLIDCFVAAVPVGVMGFPLWITFTLFVATIINNAFARGLAGVPPALLAFAAGSLVGAAAGGFRVSPENGPWVTALCIFGLSWYLMCIAHVAFKRAQMLRATREDLKQGELALKQANEVLHARLDEIRGLQEQLREQANRDPLTGLYNRRYLQETRDRELARCHREGARLSVILIDIDHFKAVNDRHGHQVGDEVIRKRARPETAERLLDNRYYRAVSTRLTGSHEYMAIEKLHELVTGGDYDRVIVDTPPTQHVVDFFRAPERVQGILDRSLLRVLFEPGSATMSIRGAAARGRDRW